MEKTFIISSQKITKNTNYHFFNMSVNRVTLIGNVGNEANIRTAGDQKVATFTLATTEKYRGKDGNMVESTGWHNIQVWGRQAEVVEKYVSKGTQLYIEGKIKTEKFTGKDGQEKFMTRIVASSLQLLGGKKDSQSAPQSPAPQQKPKTTPIVDDLPPDDSGLPF